MLACQLVPPQNFTHISSQPACASIVAVGHPEFCRAISSSLRLWVVHREDSVFDELFTTKVVACTCGRLVSKLAERTHKAIVFLECTSSSLSKRKVSQVIRLLAWSETADTAAIL